MRFTILAFLLSIVVFVFAAPIGTSLPFLPTYPDSPKPHRLLPCRNNPKTSMPLMWDRQYVPHPLIHLSPYTHQSQRVTRSTSAQYDPCLLSLPINPFLHVHLRGHFPDLLSKGTRVISLRSRFHSLIRKDEVWYTISVTRDRL